MIKSNIIQLPDYGKYVGKEFIITEYVDMFQLNLERPLLKGVKFIIKKIENSNVTIKISNTTEELYELGMLDYDFNKKINYIKSNVEDLELVYKMWTDEPDKFIKLNHDSHCINTGYYNIPPEHPDKYDMAKAQYDDKGKYIREDTIMTYDYKRTDGKTNTYSYQKNCNEFYSKDIYYYKLKAEKILLKSWNNKTEYCKNIIANWILIKQDMTIINLNKIKFKQVN